jgi:acetyl-CoA C-acetyltransferase/acetyl-CoA acyltransferase
VIVSTARTGVGKAYRGALNNTEGPTMAGHVIAAAVKRAGIEPGEVEDVVMGCAMQQGTMVMNVARKGAIRAGLPVTVAGTTIDRQCASGLQAIAVAARAVMHDGVEVAIGGGIESISLVQNEAGTGSRGRRRVDGDEAGNVCRCWRRPRSSPSATDRLRPPG